MNNNNEMLVPAPDYPLWTAAVSLFGGKAVHYRCDEEQNWFPDLDDIRKKLSLADVASSSLIPIILLILFTAKHY
ncbi:Glutamate-pyruvate aminotransferase AlaA [Arsenophonus endosymbiont of Bemisia tabaci Q2]|nr:Glutamate-pyruvate aminotransferase AlaA [Arsenophonus endosymbiont of Bemisia tabaci Q2]